MPKWQKIFFAAFVFGAAAILARLFSLDAPSSMQWTFYIGLAGGCIFIATIAAFGSSAARAGTILTVVTVAISVHVLNGVLLVFPEMFDLTQSTKYQTVMNLQESGKDAWPSVHANGLFQRPEAQSWPFVPLSGLANKLTVYCNESGKMMIYLADRYGFTNPDSIHDSDRQAAALVGDSYAQDACVQPEQTIAATLLRMGKPTISFGFGGNGPLANLTTLMEYVEPKPGTTVFWLHYDGNDLSDLTVERKSTFYMDYLDRGRAAVRGIKNRLDEQDKILREAVEQAAKSKSVADGLPQIGTKLSDVLKLRALRRLVMNLPILKKPSNSTNPETIFQFANQVDALSEDNIEVFERTLKSAQDYVRDAGASFVFVYIPPWERFAHGVKPYRAKVLAVVNRLNIPLIDVEQSMLASKDPLQFYPFRARNHFNAEGYALVAQLLNERMN